MIVLAPADTVIAKKTMPVHSISWSSTLIRRVCRSTMMAETFAMTKGTDAGARIRAIIVDAKGELDLANWEESSAESMGHCWMTDCESLFEHLAAPKLNTIDNKRLAIDLTARRPYIWERQGERLDMIDHSYGDYPRWIDTSVMIADPLTKDMNADRLINTVKN